LDTVGTCGCPLRAYTFDIRYHGTESSCMRELGNPVYTELGIGNLRAPDNQAQMSEIGSIIYNRQERDKVVSEIRTQMNR